MTASARCLISPTDRGPLRWECLYKMCIRDRYLEFGGKLFDDYHASRVLPGFEPDSKVRMLQQLRDDVEIVIAINAADIEKNKVRGDLGITYDDDVLRLIDSFRSLGLYVGSVVLTRYSGQSAADAFFKRLNTLGIRCYRHYPIAGYPSDVPHIVSDEGLGRNDYIETSHSLVVVTAPGPGSGKMATCLSQLYHEDVYKRQSQSRPASAPATGRRRSWVHLRRQPSGSG